MRHIERMYRSGDIELLLRRSSGGDVCYSFGWNEMVVGGRKSTKYEASIFSVTFLHFHGHDGGYIRKLVAVGNEEAKFVEAYPSIIVFVQI